ncbi:hypothetical protein VTL71DRAFT_12604 [Oculimacula yallundae]|uniref:Uncharacterized protein n=1 Tax=Oculimacula yallundae TaxID=86028 RepID=A0ABR4CNJ2_9HELO
MDASRRLTRSQSLGRSLYLKRRQLRQVLLTSFATLVNRLNRLVGSLWYRFSSAQQTPLSLPKSTSNVDDIPLLYELRPLNLPLDWRIPTSIINNNKRIAL